MSEFEITPANLIDEVRAQVLKAISTAAEEMRGGSCDFLVHTEMANTEGSSEAVAEEMLRWFHGIKDAARNALI